MSKTEIDNPYKRAKDLLSDARTAECLESLVKLIEVNKGVFSMDSQYNALVNELVLLKNRFNSIERSKNIGGKEEERQNKLTQAILVFIDLLEKEICAQKDNQQSLLFVNENRGNLSIKIEADFDSFDEKKQQELKDYIINILSLNPTELIIKNIKSGSVIVEIEMPIEKVMQLKSLIKLGLLKGIADAVTVENADYEKYSNLYLEGGLNLNSTDIDYIGKNKFYLTNLQNMFKKLQGEDIRDVKDTFTALIGEGSKEPEHIWTGLRVVDLRWADFSGADLSGAKLSETKLSEAIFNQTKLAGSDLRWTELNSAELIETDLTEANLTGANLIEADLTGADLTGADLTGANLTGANLTGANLSGANLSGAKLTRAILIEADLIGANLIEADLTGAELTRAKLTNATAFLSHRAIFVTAGADIAGVNFIDDELRKKAFEYV